MNQWYNELAESISLDGDWEFELAGQTGAFHAPGVWEAQGYPRRVDGPAFFYKQMVVPTSWHGGRVQLQFDAVSYQAIVEVNGVTVGAHTGLWTPFAFDVTAALRFGESNDIRLTVYKPGERFPMRESLAGFLPDVAVTFGGIWQSARLVAFPGAALSDVRLVPDSQTGNITIRAAVHEADSLTGTINIEAPDGSLVTSNPAPIHAGHIDISIRINQPQTWRPDQPTLYTAEICLNDKTSTRARLRRTFGFRSLSHKGEQLLFNDAPSFLRGLLNWGWYPDILCPAPDEKTIRDEFRRVRELGYNMVKLCLYVPSSLYFDIADQEGMFLWLELPLWLPRITPPLREQAPIEYADILKSVHHHPSIVIYSLGCELGDDADAELLSQLNKIVRGSTSGVLVCDNSGSGEAYGGLSFDYADFNDYHFYCDLHYFTPLVDHFKREWRSPRPWIFGEFCDADDYRDLDEIAAAFGGHLPWWYTEQNPVHALSAIAYSQQTARMANLELGFDHQALQRISRRQSFVVRKTTLEKVRARAGMGGYIVTGIRETPLATSSMFDDLGRAKYPPEDFRQFNAEAVLVLEQGRARAWKHGGDRPAPLDKHNYWAGAEVNLRVVLANTGAPIPAGELSWQVLAPNGQRYQTGATPVTEVPSGSVPHKIASIHFIAPDVESAGQYLLVVELNSAVRNQWPLWFYPRLAPWPGRITVYDPFGLFAKFDDVIAGAQHTTTLSDLSGTDGLILLSSVYTEEVYNHVARGGRALVLQTGAGTLPALPCPFWRESIKLLYDHPILASFPHQGYVDLQWYNLASDYALDTTQLQAVIPATNRAAPVIRRLDARQFTTLDYLVELEMGAGKLLVSTLRFQGGAGDQIIDFKSSVVRQFLLHGILTYLLE